MSRVLVVCYSRTGHTRQVAEAILELTGWDLDPIVELRDRAGLRGYLRAGFDVLAHRPTRLARARLDPRLYDLVVVGSPIWGGNVSVPVRTWLSDHAHELRRVAFFLSCGGSGAKAVLKQMQELAGQAPVATLVVTEGQLRRGSHLDAVERFVEAVRPPVSDELRAAADAGSGAAHERQAR